jgi:isopentenyldiphosphate isomerase
MEYWNLYDNRGFLTDKTHRRGDPLETGFFHMVVSNWIKNDEGRYLIQKRTKPLGDFINPWSSTAGAALIGERSVESIQRETREEMGLLFNLKEFRFIERSFFDVYFLDIYETTWNGQIEDLNIDPNEVADAKWVTRSEIQQMYASKEFYDRSTNYFNKILGYSFEQQELY